MTAPYNNTGLIGGLIPSVKRKAFFSFHFDDIMRVNVVRNAWKGIRPDSTSMRSFYDSSLWESRKAEGEDAIKKLIRDGVNYTSAVCVLVGTETWLRRWVKYEIARGVIDGRGLLALHINNIRHHQTLGVHPLGINPFDGLGVGKVQESVFNTPRYYLFERTAVRNTAGGFDWSWPRYKDYTDPVKLPTWLSDPAPGYVTPLSTNVDVYDYTTQEGHKNLGAWIDRAAQRSGR
ncbi:MAG: TIR domain-containing protein [Patescibacteria group bacterium]|nr:TIR domain-containing protein [Patescibacteria group bacterium]